MAYGDIRWQEPIGMGPQALCNICARFHRSTTAITCDAFPDGIPPVRLDLVEGDEAQAAVCNDQIGYKPVEPAPELHI